MLYAGAVTGARENERTRIICQTQFSRKNMLLTWKKVLHNKTIQEIKKENGLYKNRSYINFCTYIYDSYSSQCVNITIINRHAGTVPGDLPNCLKVLKKCQNKFDCLVNEMLIIKQLQPCLNVQSDSIRAKVFV